MLSGLGTRKRLACLLPGWIAVAALLSGSATAGAPTIAWVTPGGGAADLSRFPAAPAPAWLEIAFPGCVRVTGGVFGLAGSDANGSVPLRIEIEGRRPPGGRDTWTCDPPEDGRGCPPGTIGLATASEMSGTIRVPVRIAVGGGERPIRVTMSWAVLRSPMGDDTLLFDPPPAIGILGGVPQDGAVRDARVQALSPRVLAPEGTVTLLGADLDRLPSLCILDSGGAAHALTPLSRSARARVRLRLPALLPAGAARLAGPDLVPLDCGAMRIVDSGARMDEPIWDERDGDVLVIAVDDLAASVGVLLGDLRSRGFRPAYTSLGRIVQTYGGDGIATCDAIRSAIIDACESFRTCPLAVILIGTASEDQPENDRLPTVHVFYDHDLFGWYDDTFAEDYAYGDLPGTPDLAPGLIVGRIPARAPDELSAYVAKLAAYRSQPALPNCLIAVGDANVNRDNSDRRRAAESLIEIARADCGLTVDAQYASAYMPLSDQANRVRALNDFQTRLARGVGLLDVFGNNTGPTDIAHMLTAPPGARQPWLIPSEMPTAGKLPIAIFHTCLNGAFDEDGHFPEFDSPAEMWVREPGRGAIAVLAQSHITEFFDDCELAGQLLRRIAMRDGATLGAIHAGIRANLLRESTRGARSAASVRMGNLLGDPLLVPRLGLEQIRLDGSFEAAGAWPGQNVIIHDNEWTCGGFDEACAIARVVDGGVHAPSCGEAAEPPVFSVGGGRMLRIAGAHAPGVGRRAAAWRIFSCNLRVGPGASLSYWVRQETDPRGRGRLALDAVTASGRILSREMIDDAGLPADPARYAYSLGRWHRIAVRLDRWAGERIRAIYVRYEDARRPDDPERTEDGAAGGGAGGRHHVHPENEPDAPGGAFAGYLDEVRITPGPAPPLLDTDLSTDENGDGRPDGWTATWPASCQNEEARGSIVRCDGPAALWMTAEQVRPTGVSRLLGRAPPEDPFLRLRLEIKGNVPLRLAVVDPLTGHVFDSQTLPPSNADWAQREVTLAVPPERPALFEIRPDGDGAVGVRSLHVDASGPSDTRSKDARSPARDPSGITVAPNPATDAWSVACRATEGPITRIELYDLTGRRVASWLRGVARSGGTADADCVLWKPMDDGGRKPVAGVYFLRIRTSVAVHCRTVEIVR